MQPSALYGKFPSRDAVWKEIVPTGDEATANAGVTSLLAFTDYGSAWRALYVVLFNDSDEDVALDLVVDVSHNGWAINDELTHTKTCPAQKEVSVLLGPPNPDTYVRIQVVNNTATPVLFSWALLGIPR